MHRLVEISDEVCRDPLRMDRISFVRLCDLLGDLGGLSNFKHVMSVQEKVSMFLSILAHHTKNRGCLGALDGTYIEAKVPEVDKTRYRNRKGQLIVNVLGVCDTNMQFVYVLPGWEGSAVDSRVLRDAISRRNGLKIPKGNYYLADNGHPNAE
ncbi:hypothetical protein ACS0TY_015421 [Phlomoides rotata]